MEDTPVVNIHKTDDAALLKIEGEMTIYHASLLKDRVIKGLDGAVLIDIDLSGISEMDTSGAQLLLLLRKEAQGTGKTVRVVSKSDSVAAVFETLGLNPVFGG